MESIQYGWHIEQRWTPHEWECALARFERDRGNLTVAQCVTATRFSQVYPATLGCAVAQHYLNNSPIGELLLGVSMSARIGWMHSGRKGSTIDDPLLQGLAVGDRLVVQRFIETMEPWNEEPGGFNIKCHGVVAVLNRDWAALKRGLSQPPSHTSEEVYMVLKDFLLGLMNNDPHETATALQNFFDISKRQRIKGWLRNAFDYETHGLFHLAEGINPQLVANFDKLQSRPWDSDIYNAVSRGRDPWDHVDLRNISIELHDAITTLSRPVWWE